MEITPTARELMDSPAFWSKRMHEQVKYILTYAASDSPRAEELFQSAWDIHDRAAQEYRRTRLLETRNPKPETIQ